MGSPQRNLEAIFAGLHTLTVAVCVCVSVLTLLIVDYGQPVRVLVFFHKTEYIGKVLRIQNLKGHQNWHDEF